MPKSEYQLNRVFESDGEIFELNGSRVLFSMDEFSEEDMFREHDPFTLGWNLAVGAVSDILACGGRPLFYAHSMIIKDKWDEEFIKSFSTGVASVLKKCQIGFLGGDFGKSKIWHYTGAVIGMLEGKPLLRRGAQPGDGIYLSGEIGAGNLEAFLKLYSEKTGVGKFSRLVKNRFPLRIKEAEHMKKYAHAAMDTSDGVFNALNSLSEMSGTGYEVGDLPYHKTGRTHAKLFKIPKTLLFLGECGEYELIFTVGPEDEENFLQGAREQELKFYKIGRVTDKGSRVLYEGTRKIDLSRLEIRARDFGDIEKYIQRLISFIREK